MVTLPDNVRERVVSYVKDQVAKGTEAITESVQTGHDQLLSLLDGMSEEQAKFKPSAESWSVLELLQHVVTAKRGTARLCAALARGETPQNVGREGEEASYQDGITRVSFRSLAEAQPAVQSAHEELIAFIAGVSPKADLDTRFKHFLFGALNCQEWAVFQRVHDGDHARQIEQIKAAPDFSSA